MVQQQTLEGEVASYLPFSAASDVLHMDTALEFWIYQDSMMASRLRCQQKCADGI